MQKNFSGKTQVYFLKFLFLSPGIIEKGHQTPISQFSFNPLNFVSFLNFVSLFPSRENETKMSGDSIYEVITYQNFKDLSNIWLSHT